MRHGKEVAVGKEVASGKEVMAGRERLEKSVWEEVVPWKRTSAGPI
jgi:hypothetical protein